MAPSTDQSRFRSLTKSFNHAFCIFWVVALYITTIYSLTTYLHNTIHYSGVQHWPTVPVDTIETGGQTYSHRAGSRYGAERSTTTDTRWVKYTYTVQGTTYTSNRSTPGSRRPDWLPERSKLKAHYNPKHPEVAVLTPIPYENDFLLVLLAFLTPLTLGHLYFTIRKI